MAILLFGKAVIFLKFMELAIEEAKKAFDADEVPVGCIITYKNEIISSAHNLTEFMCNSTRHAEINAIETAIKHLETKDLSECDMYVTLEPCPMCAGAIINTKIKRLYIGAQEPKSGCFGSKVDFNRLGFNHTPEVYVGINEDECKKLMQSFFKNKR